MKSFATFRPLIRSNRENVRTSLEQVARSLSTTGEQTRIHFRLLNSGKREAWTVHVGGKKADVQDRHTGKPKVEVVTRVETWNEIALGKLSPLEAFVTGRLRVRGDVEMTKRMLRHLCEPNGVIDIC
jgi:putative sterol carrier protein